jgi:hypothetical protein
MAGSTGRIGRGPVVIAMRRRSGMIVQLTPGLLRSSLADKIGSYLGCSVSRLLHD